MRHINNIILAVTLLVTIWVRDPETVAGFLEIENAGSGDRVKSLDRGNAEMMARTLLGECAKCGDDELRWIGHVILNRWRSGRYGDEIMDVVTFKRGGVYAFSCWNPRLNKREVTGAHVDRSGAFRRMLGIVETVWQERIDPTSGAVDFYHPAGMKPAHSVPKWALNRVGHRVGGAIFFR